MREKRINSKADNDYLVAAIVLLVLQVLLFAIYYVESDFDLGDFTPKTSSKRLHLVEREKPAGETYDYSGQYRIFRHFKTHNAYKNELVSLVTWSTLETLPYLANVTKEWQGDASCAVFVNFSEASLVGGILDKYLKCHRHMNDRVSFHLVYEADSHLSSFDLHGWEAFSCKRLDHELTNWRTSAIIPTTLLYNVARSTSTAQYFIFAAANLTPSPSMRDHVVELISSGNLSENTALLIPSFAATAASLSRDNLRSLYAKHEATSYPFQFRSKFNTTMVDAWLNGESAFEQVNWNINWSPAFLVHRSSPYFDERFVSVDHDRSHLLCELKMMNYSFFTSGKMFLVGKSMAHILERNDDTELRLQSWFLFNYQFKDEIRNKYKSSLTCLEDDDRGLANLKDDFGSMSNEYIRYDVQRNQMGEPVKVVGPIAYSITGDIGESRIQKKPQKQAAVKRMTLEEAMKNQALKARVPTFRFVMRVPQIFFSAYFLVYCNT